MRRVILTAAMLSMIGTHAWAGNPSGSSWWQGNHTPHAQEVIPYSDNAPSSGGGFIQRGDSTRLVRPGNNPNPHVDQYFRTGPNTGRMVLCFGKWFCRPQNR